MRNDSCLVRGQPLRDLPLLSDRCRLHQVSTTDLRRRMVLPPSTKRILFRDRRGPNQAKATMALTALQAVYYAAMVEPIAKRFLSECSLISPAGDLEREVLEAGTISLRQALFDFTPRRGQRFEDFVCPLVTEAMKRTICCREEGSCEFQSQSRD